MTEYHPDSVSAPGRTLQEALEERGIVPAEFAQQLGITVDYLDALFEGKAALTPEIAESLEQLIGIPARFWLKREKRYQEYLHQKTPA